MRLLMTVYGGGRAPDEHMYAGMGRFVEELARVIEAVRYEVEPAVAGSPVSALSRAWYPAPAVGAGYTYPFRRVTAQDRAVGRAGFAGCVRCPSPVVVALVAWGG